MIFTLPGGFSLSLSWWVLAVVGTVVAGLAAGYIMWSRNGNGNGNKEDFESTSPGTLTQLSANHVPTEEDEHTPLVDGGGDNRVGSSGTGDVGSSVGAPADDMTHDYSPV